MECHACGAEISEKAADCPQCGASVRDLSGSADDGVTGGSDTTVDGTGSRDGDTEPVDGGSSAPTVPGSDATETDPEGSSTDADTDEAGGGSTRRTAESESSVESRDAESSVGAEGLGGEQADDASGPSESDDAAGTAGTAGDAGPEQEETGWEAAGPPPGDREDDGDEAVTDPDEESVERAAGVGHESDVGGQEPTVPGESDQVEADPVTGGVGEGTDATGQRTTGGEGDVDDVDGAESQGADRDTGDGLDPVEQIKSLPLLTAPLAGVVTAVVIAVLSTVVGVLTPNTGSDPVTVGAVVFFDLHFATQGHLPVGLLTQFDTARPPDATLGILYLLAPLFLYTAAKFVTAYNTDDTTLTPVAGVGGTLVAVGYFPAVIVALFLAPGGPLSPVKLLPAILLAGVVYPVFFGGIGGLVAGALSGSERRIGTLYGVVSFFLISVGSLALTIPAIQVSDVGLLPQVHASLFTVVAVNGLRLGDPDIGMLVLLAYPMVAFVVFAAGALRAWNAEDVAGPLRGVAKGLSPVATYLVLLGLLATVLPLLADPWIARELGLSANGEALVGFLVQTKLFTIGQYVTSVFVGTLVFPVVLGGSGGLIAGTARYVLSDEE